MRSVEHHVGTLIGSYFLLQVREKELGQMHPSS